MEDLKYLIKYLEKNELAILCDSPKKRGSDLPIFIIPTPKVAQREYISARAHLLSNISTIWETKIHNTLINKFAPRVRIFCEPEIREHLMIHLGPDGLRDALVDAAKKVHNNELCINNVGIKQRRLLRFRRRCWGNYNLNI